MNVIAIGLGDFDNFFVVDPKTTSLGEVLKDFSGIELDEEDNEETFKQIEIELEDYECRVVFEDKDFVIENVTIQELGMTMFDYCNSVIENFID